MAATVIQGSVFDVLPTLPAGWADCVVTSPPYWQLRSYLKNDHPLKRHELGAEPTPEAFVDNLVRVFREVRRVMADHATCWLNIGDSYNANTGTGFNASQRGASYRPGGAKRRKELAANGITKPPKIDLDAGNLCLIPQRLALALQADGWLVRSVIVWHKPAPMPASVSGWQWRRCRVKVKGTGWGGADGSIHPSKLRDGKTMLRENSGGVPKNGVAEWRDCEGCPKCAPHGGYVLRRGSWRPTSSWEPILMLAKSAKYFADGDAVRQPPAAATVSRDQYTRVLDDPDEQFAVRHDHETISTSANLRDVWTISHEPLTHKHYASYPSELVYRCLKAGTSARGYCPTCSAPWARVVETERNFPSAGRNGHPGRYGDTDSMSAKGFGLPSLQTESRTLGWRQTCPCPPHEPRAGRVLDCFSGSGRTGLEALRLGLDYTGVDLNPEYVDLSRRLLRDESPLFSGVTP